MLFRTIFAPVRGLRLPKYSFNGHRREPRPAPIQLSFEDAMERLAAGRRVVVASNRGPVEYVRDGEGRLEAKRGSGGLATLLGALSHSSSFSWVVSPMTEGDREVSGKTGNGRAHIPLNGGHLDLRFVVTPPEVYDRYYSVFANPLLWFLQHYMWDLAHGPTINAASYDAWENGYVPVNQAFADAVVHELDGDSGRAGTPDGLPESSQSDKARQGARNAEAGGRPVVFFQDYHLYLAPGYVRERVPDAVLQHFIHVPWPAPRYWLLLPEAMRLPIIRSLCQNDIVGFQTARDVQNFLATCEAFLPDARVDYRSSTVRWQERTIFGRSYPVSIDTRAVRETAASPEARQYRENLEPLRGEQTIVRVDRLEPSKNIYRGFLAFDGLLNRYPELAGKVKFWAFLVPSRTDLRQYKEYKKEVFALVEQINERHGNDAWRPVHVFYENNYAQALAGMTFYDVLLVNPVIDGMNLVAKEGPTVNERDGVLVISEGAGAHAQLGPHSLTVAATDVEGTIQALYQALMMPPAERSYRGERLREAVEREDLNVWLQAQVADLLGVLEAP